TNAGGVAAIAGYTNSASFNLKNELYSTFAGGQEGFVALFDTSSSGAGSLIYSTYLGGDATDIIEAVDIDADENVYVFGGTSSTNYPTTSEGLFSTYSNNFDPVLSKFSPNGDELLYSTYFRVASNGAVGSEAGYALVVNDEGRAYGA